MSLDDVKAVKNHFGVTVNDVVLGLVGGTLRRYLDAHGGVPDEPLLAVVPRLGPHATTTPAAATACRPCSRRSPPTSTIPGARLQAIHEVTKGAKEEHNAVGADMLQNWAEFAGPNLINLASRLYSNLSLADSHRPIHNVIISNVPGPDFPLYYAGAELVAAYPMGPVMEGTGLNVTVMSYRGSIDIGFMVDEDLVPDVWEMADAVEPALAELLAAGRLANAPPKRAARRRDRRRGRGRSAGEEEGPDRLAAAARTPR